MPLCPQITNTPITVVQNSDFTVASVLPVVPATTTQVNTAQATATAALANAAIAYNAAVASLQPSASTIVNASNQMTAIAANGITVYSGASATSGARVVMNSLGLAGYNAAGSAIFSITASTGAAVFSGSITGSAITGSTLNINGNAIIDASGFLTASGATVTGTINATSGYIGSPSTGWNFSSSGYFYNSGSTTILYPSTSPGGNANTYAFYTDRGYYGNQFYCSSSTAASIFSLGGISVNGQVSGAAGSFVVNSSGNITTVGSITASGAITTSSNISTSSSGTITAAGELIANQAISVSVSAATNCYITSSGQIRKTSNTSSERFKENITDIANVPELDPKALLNLPVRAFSYIQNHLPVSDDRYEQMLPGFIAEEVDAIYPIAVDYDNGDIQTWNSFWIVPSMLSLIQDLYKEIDQLKGA